VPPAAATTLGLPDLDPDAYTGDADAEQAEGRRELEDEAARLDGLLRVAGVRVESGQPASTIAALARDEGVHLVAMSTHGRGGLSRLVMGSVATGTLRQATVPLLLVPAAARAAVVRDAVLVESERQATPATPAVSGGMTLTLDQNDLALVRYGLEMLLFSRDRDDELTTPVRDLRARFAASPTPDALSTAP
jgi:hypothetical protein